jgi:hypothetical protein
MAMDFFAPSSLMIAYGNVTVGTSANAGFTVRSLQNVGNRLTITSVNITGTGASSYANNPTIVGRFFKNGVPNIAGTMVFTPVGVGPFSASFTVSGEQFVGGVDSGPVGTSHAVTLSGTGVAATGGGGGVGEVPAVLQSFRRELIPVNSGSAGIVLAYFNEANFNDVLDSSIYVFKAEDIVGSRVPTVRRVVLTYLDLGTATISVTINGTNDLGAVVSNTVVMSIGNIVPTNSLLTAFVDIELTSFRPQLSISRAPGAGPVVITMSQMIGTVETQGTL